MMDNIDSLFAVMKYIILPMWILGVIAYALIEVFFTGDDDELGE